MRIMERSNNISATFRRFFYEIIGKDGVMGNFIVVWGPARTGTSLVCKLLEASGYNFGSDINLGMDVLLTSKSHKGTHEHTITSFPLDHHIFRGMSVEEVIEKHKKTIIDDNITAAKVIGFSDMLDPIVDLGFTLKIIGTNRLDDKARIKSVISNRKDDIARELNDTPLSYKEAARMVNVSDERAQYIENHLDTVPYMDVVFEDLLTKDIKLLESFCKFIDVKPKASLIKVLSSIIKPSLRRF